MQAAWPFSRLLAPVFRVCLLILSICAASPLANAASQSPHASNLVTQEFFCYAGLDHNQCLLNVAKLRAELVRYSPDLPRYWSWVIVGSEDWQSVMLTLHLDSRSPAFTSLKAHETFLEGALFLTRSVRMDELAKTLDVPVDQLLTIVVSHELGHAICDEGREKIANRVSEELRRGGNIDCTSSLAPGDELYLPGQPRGLRLRDP